MRQPAVHPKGSTALPKLFFISILLLTACSPDLILVDQNSGSSSNVAHVHDILISDPQDHQNNTLTGGTTEHLEIDYTL